MEEPLVAAEPAAVGASRRRPSCASRSQRRQSAGTTPARRQSAAAAVRRRRRASAGGRGGAPPAEEEAQAAGGAAGRGPAVAAKAGWRSRPAERARQQLRRRECRCTGAPGDRASETRAAARHDHDRRPRSWARPAAKRRIILVSDDGQELRVALVEDCRLARSTSSGRTRSPTWATSTRARSRTYGRHRRRLRRLRAREERLPLRRRGHQPPRARSAPTASATRSRTASRSWCR